MASPLTFLFMIPTCGTGTVIKTIQLQYNDHYMPFQVVLNRGVPIIGSADILATDMAFFTNIGIGTKQ